MSLMKRDLLEKGTTLILDKNSIIRGRSLATENFYRTLISLQESRSKNLVLSSSASSLITGWEKLIP